MNIALGIVFIVIFYFVFGFIWRHTKTISFNGLGGFLDSWISQVICAAVISYILAALIVGGTAEIGISIGKFLRGLDFFDIAIAVFLIFFIYSAFAEDVFDRKTFRNNFNNKINELFANAPLITFSTIGLLTGAGENDGYLPEDFVTTGNSKLTNFPTCSIEHMATEKFKRIKLNFDFSSVRNDEIGMAGINSFMEIIIGAMIEAVANDKSAEVESALNLTNEGYFYMPPQNYTKDCKNGVINFHFTKNATSVLFSMTKRLNTSEGN